MSTRLPVRSSVSRFDNNSRRAKTCSNTPETSTTQLRLSADSLPTKKCVSPSTTSTARNRRSAGAACRIASHTLPWHVEILMVAGNCSLKAKILRIIYITLHHECSTTDLIYAMVTRNCPTITSSEDKQCQVDSIQVDNSCVNIHCSCSVYLALCSLSITKHVNMSLQGWLLTCKLGALTI